MSKLKSEHITTQPSKDKTSKREHFFPPSTASGPPPSSEGGWQIIISSATPKINIDFTATKV